MIRIVLSLWKIICEFLSNLKIIHLNMMKKPTRKPTSNQKKKPQEKDILNYCKKPRSLKEIYIEFGFKDTRTFKKNYLNNLIDNKKLEMTIPEQPRNKNQKYITVK